MASSPPPPVEDQARLLEDALSVVRQQTLLMRRCLETPGKLMDALKCGYAPAPIANSLTSLCSLEKKLTPPQVRARLRTTNQQPGPQTVL